MPMLRTIERPTIATLRRWVCAASSTCWTRCTCEANEATMTRFSADSNSWSSTGAISISWVVKPGTSALVESTMNRSTPSSPSRANARRSVIRPSSGSWSILKSPVCSTLPDGVRHGDELAVEGPEALQLALADPQGHRRDLVLLELGLDEGQRELGPHDGDVGPQPEQVGHGADVVLVPVRQDQRLDVIEALVLTHGHEDHIGAVPYLLRLRPDIPVVGSQLTLAFVEAKLKEHQITPVTLG